MTTHLGVMILFAALVSVVFATLMRDRRAEQVHFGARVFVGLVAGAYLGGWLLFLVFG